MHITPGEALQKPTNSGKLFIELFTHGTLSIEIYKPAGEDHQQPHDRDEVYVVISGQGEFTNGDHRVKFGPGDFLFVKSGITHRFENFSDDFATWVMFYGPKGGEV